jgi:hypothetical protein
VLVLASDCVCGFGFRLCVGFGFRLCVLVLASDYVIIHKHVFLLQVAEEAMRTKHELQKKERTSMLANISFEQHSFSLKPPATNQMQSPSSVCEKEQSFVTGITSKPPLPVTEPIVANGVSQDLSSLHESESCEDEPVSKKRRRWFPQIF